MGMFVLKSVQLIVFLLELDCGLFSGGKGGKGDRFESKEEWFACRIEYLYVYLYVCVMIE